MKKLMTMIAAVAMVFGLFADSLDNRWSAQGVTTETWNQDGLWTGEGVGGVTVGTDLIDIKTGGKTLTRQATDTTFTVTDNVYFDVKTVKIGVVRSKLPKIPSDAKLALFLLDGSAVEGAPAGTNLFAVGYHYDADGKKALYCFGDGSALATSARRLTVNAYKNVLLGGSHGGFTVFVDGDSEVKDPLSVQAVYPYDANGKVRWDFGMPVANCMKYLGLDVKVATPMLNFYSNTKHNLILGLVPDEAGAIFTGIDFIGNAKITDIALTETKPGFIGPDFAGMRVMIEGDGISLEGVGFGGGITEDCTLHVLYTGPVQNPAFTTTLPAYAQVDGRDIKVTYAPGLEFRVHAVPTVAKVGDKCFGTFEEARVYVTKNGGTLQLAGDVAAEDGAYFNTAKSVVLDLAGHKLALNGRLLVNNANLTIMDSHSEGGGEIIGNVWNEYGNLVISNGVFNGNVENGSADPAVLAMVMTTIYGGTFKGKVENVNSEDPIPSMNEIVAYGGDFLKTANTMETLRGYAAKNYGVFDDLPDYYTIRSRCVVRVVFKDSTYEDYVEPSEALAKVQELEAAGSYPIQVICLAADGLTITDENRTLVLAKDQTVACLEKNAWYVTGTMVYSGKIEGSVIADEIQIYGDATTIELGVNAIVKVDPGTALTEASFTAPAGYKVAKEETTDFVQFTVRVIQYWTVSIADVENCTISVTNGDVEVTSGAKFDQNLTTVLKVTRTPVNGYKLAVGYLAYEEITLCSDTTITALVVADGPEPIKPGAPLGPYDTAVDATNAMMQSVFAPSEEVAAVLTDGAARRRYDGWFGLVVTSKGTAEWYVEAALTDAAKTRLAETAANATRQIPVGEIAAMSMTGKKIVPVEGCEPGFYYTLYGGQGLIALPETGAAYRADPCDAEGKVVFPAVAKPSDTMGFFRVGVDATKGE